MGFLLWIAALAGIDLGIKNTIEETDSLEFPKDLEGTKGMIVLHKNHNDGFPFGFLRSRPEVVRQVPLAVTSALGGVFLWLLPRKGYFGEKVGLAFLLGGGISNLYDRLTRGYVVDYFSIQCRKLKDVVFNLGDIFVFIGGFVLLAAGILSSEK